MSDKKSEAEALVPVERRREELAASPHPTRVINLSADVVARKTEAYPEEQRNLLRWVHGYARDRQWGWDDAANNTHLSVSTLWRIWNGKYRDPKTGDLVALNGVCEKLERFRSLAMERALAHKLPYVETGVFKRIQHACREALVMQTFAMIYGETQIGKTAALREVARRNAGNTTYVLTPASSGVQGLIRAIGDACHIAARTSNDVLRGRLWNYFDDSKLLILDEVHEIFATYYKVSRLRCFSVLRQLQESTQCGLVLCGTTDGFRKEIESGEFAQSLKQLRERGIWEVQLESRPTSKDLELIAEHYKLGTPTGETARLVRDVTMSFGLGKYTKFLARASQLASKKGERFAWRHFCDLVAIANRLKEEAK